MDELIERLREIAAKLEAGRYQVTAWEALNGVVAAGAKEDAAAIREAADYMRSIIEMGPARPVVNLPLVEVSQ